MRISTLRVSNFRCIEAANIELAPQLNAICGSNGSGKTSLIEAAYFLTRADSFRPGRRQRLIRDGSSQASIFAKLASQTNPQHRLGVDIGQPEETARIRHNGETLKVHELVRLLPVLFVDPVLHQLLEEGPAHRRRFLDWGVFHVEHAFFDAWRRYRRALQQRNRALRAGAGNASIEAWEPELISTAGIIDELRHRQMERLCQIMPDLLPENLRQTQFEYRPGWAQGMSFAQALQASRERDREAGFTQRGPHRADLRILLQGHPVPERASRGEQKVITIAMHLAQARSLKHSGQNCLLLIDDLAAELGLHYQRWLEDCLRAAECQCLLSFLDPSRAPADARMFHVEHGVVKQLGGGVTG